jgi:hypothetical protein
MVANHKIFFIFAWSGDLYVSFVESGFTKPFRHGLGGAGYVTRGICGIDFDQLLEDIVREALVFLRRPRGGLIC